MTYTSIKCPNCGSNCFARQGGGLNCAFCGTGVTLRLDPGTVCADEAGPGPCTQLAESLCRSCGRPLCDRHNDPKRHYWQHLLDLRALCPEWTAQDATDWAGLQARPADLPLHDFTPFEWIHHSRESLYALGQLEEEIAAAIRPVVEKGVGELRETVCIFDSVCSACMRALTGEIDAKVSEFRDRFRTLAFERRLDAERDDSEQALRYIEEFLGCPVDCTAARPAEDDAKTPLSAESDLPGWHSCGAEHLCRLQTISRLRRRLDREGRTEE